MPGEMHAWLAEGVGEWDGKTTMWMFPGSEPVTSECTSTVTSMMDGRYIKCEIDGEAVGFAFYGSGNVELEIKYENKTKIAANSTGLAISFFGNSIINPNVFRVICSNIFGAARTS